MDVLRGDILNKVLEKGSSDHSVICCKVEAGRRLFVAAWTL
jgi:hypothetical protein